MTENPKFIFDPTCDVISDIHIKLCNILGNFKPGAIKFRLRIEYWSSSMIDSKGKRPPPPIGGVVSGKAPSRHGLTNISFFLYDTFFLNDVQHVDFPLSRN